MFNKKAFTMVELIASITLVVVLSVIGAITYGKYRERAIALEGKGILQDVHAAEQLYRTRNGKYAAQSSMVASNSTLGLDFRGNKYFSAFKVLPDSFAPADVNFTVITNKVANKDLTLIGNLTKRPQITDHYSGSKDE